MTALDTVLLTAVVILLVGLGVSLAILVRRKPSLPPPPALEALAGPLADLGAVRAQVDGMLQAQQSFRDGLSRLETGLKGVETRVVETSGGVRECLQRDLQGARSVLDSVKLGQESRKQMEDELQRSTRRIEAVVAGSRTRGEAGENILAEAFKSLPPGMVETDFRVGGKPVEFALRLVDGTRVPVDSKWPRAEVLDQLDRADTPERRAELAAQVQKAVEAKVKEAARYIDAASTVPWAVAAVPDAVFAVCGRAHFDAYKQKVVLMPYGLAIPYLLSLYNLHLQFSRSIQVDRLEGYLAQIDRSLEILDKNMENRISKAIAELGNAREDCRAALGKMRIASDSLRAMPAMPSGDGTADNSAIH